MRKLKRRQRLKLLLRNKKQPRPRQNRMPRLNVRLRLPQKLQRQVRLLHPKLKKQRLEGKATQEQVANKVILQVGNLEKLQVENQANQVLQIQMLQLFLISPQQRLFKNRMLQKLPKKVQNLKSLKSLSLLRELMVINQLSLLQIRQLALELYLQNQEAYLQENQQLLLVHQGSLPNSVSFNNHSSINSQLLTKLFERIQLQQLSITFYRIQRKLQYNEKIKDQLDPFE